MLTDSSREYKLLHIFGKQVVNVHNKPYKYSFIYLIQQFTSRNYRQRYMHIKTLHRII